ncbi:hypothetical protein [Halomicrobium sp. LC1Hm]|uniref:hypothetical protein n=1 Tax=Halomicrobium sp. LC1Hm TaxID=2610902 RepID=UPI0012982950|nr:hypothetical protein [Halomicrobium sp. LC1Hm]QGA84032.1 putative membrane protein [Halomicrobium sp. LC1Hm]
MPGTPEPVVGSAVVTLGLAVAVGTLVAVVPLVVGRRPSPRRYAAVGGGVYALVVGGLWAVPRIGVAGLGCSLPGDAGTCGPFALIGVLVLAGQGAVALYTHSEYGYVVPLGATVSVTLVLAWSFLQIGGESDPMTLYALFFGPAAVGVTCVLGVCEAIVRRRRETAVTAS